MPAHLNPTVIHTPAHEATTPSAPAPKKESRGRRVVNALAKKALGTAGQQESKKALRGRVREAGWFSLGGIAALFYWIAQSIARAFNPSNPNVPEELTPFQVFEGEQGQGWEYISQHYIAKQGADAQTEVDFHEKKKTLSHAATLPRDATRWGEDILSINGKKVELNLEGYRGNNAKEEFTRRILHALLTATGGDEKEAGKLALFADQAVKGGADDMVLQTLHPRFAELVDKLVSVNEKLRDNPDLASEAERLGHELDVEQKKAYGFHPLQWTRHQEIQITYNETEKSVVIRTKVRLGPIMGFGNDKPSFKELKDREAAIGEVRIDLNENRVESHLIILPLGFPIS